jgi:hypothetical protein
MSRAAWLVRSLCLLLVGVPACAEAHPPSPSIMTATWSEYREHYGKSALCGAEEVALWTCERRKRRYALCASPDVTRSAGYMQYRSSVRGKVTFMFPATRKPPLGSFTYRSFPNGDAAVEFVNGDYRYSLLDPLRGASSILVSGPGDAGSTTEISCAAGNQTLQLNYTMRMMYESGLWSGD